MVRRTWLVEEPREQAQSGSEGKIELGPSGASRLLLLSRGEGNRREETGRGKPTSWSNSSRATSKGAPHLSHHNATLRTSRTDSLHPHPFRHFFLFFFFLAFPGSFTTSAPAPAPPTTGSTTIASPPAAAAARGFGDSTALTTTGLRFCILDSSDRVKTSNRLRNTLEWVLNLRHCGGAVRCLVGLLGAGEGERTFLSSVTLRTRRPFSCRQRVQ